MTRSRILKPGEIYTFSKFFELAFDPEDILAELGCTLKRLPLDLVPFNEELDYSPLKHRIEQSLTHVDLTSEAARREVVIAPILLELCNYTHAKLKIEYPIVANEQLKGTLDYYVQSKCGLLVVEAKQGDMTRGFTQLAVELIALDQWTTLETPILYGAVTTGDVWRFGWFCRAQKQIVQDIILYRVPTDLENLLRILIGVLSPAHDVSIQAPIV